MQKEMCPQGHPSPEGNNSQSREACTISSKPSGHHQFFPALMFSSGSQHPTAKQQCPQAQRNYCIASGKVKTYSMLLTRDRTTPVTGSRGALLHVSINSHRRKASNSPAQWCKAQKIGPTATASEFTLIKQISGLMLMSSISSEY